MWGKLPMNDETWNLSQSSGRGPLVFHLHLRLDATPAFTKKSFTPLFST
jgi:hypothetical protein